MDGTDNGTTFNDQTGKTVTRYGDTKTVTGTKKLGTAAAYFDGSGDYLSLADSEDWNFGSGDFTIDFWINRTSNNNDDRVLDLANVDNVSNYGFAVWVSSTQDTYANRLCFLYSTTGTSWNNISSYGYIGNATVPINTWIHVAVVRSGTTITTYINGLADKSWNVGTGSLYNSADNIWIGQSHYQNGGRRMKAYLDELRISKGIARWTSNFTPPNSQYYWWNWGCNGLNGGSNTACGANKYQ
jgi:hypothetical protein